MTDVQADVGEHKVKVYEGAGDRVGDLPRVDIPNGWISACIWSAPSKVGPGELRMEEVEADGLADTRR